jgi:hypothetical protein
MDWVHGVLGWVFTAAFLAVAAYCVARLVAAARTPDSYRGSHRAMDVAHVLMAVGMAAMVSPVGGPLPMPAWQTVFLVMTAWFSGSWWRRRGERGGAWHGGWQGSELHHALAAAAMLYMLTAMPHGGHRAAPWLDGGLEGGLGTGMALPALGWVLAAYFLVSAVVLARGRSQAGPAGLPALLTAPAAMTACQITMAGGTGAMLVVMLA